MTPDSIQAPAASSSSQPVSAPIPVSDKPMTAGENQVVDESIAPPDSGNREVPARALETSNTTSELTVAQAILKRRSYRQFKPDPVPADVLDRLIELTLQAPSSLNSQSWRLVLIEDALQKEALSKISWGQPQIKTAPVVLIFAVNMRASEQTLETVLKQARDLDAWPETFAAMVRAVIPRLLLAPAVKVREYGIKDALVAASYCSLAAESLGLNSCFMNGWDEEGVKDVLGVKGNSNIAIALLMPIGYGLDNPKFPGRLPREVMVRKGNL